MEEQAKKVAQLLKMLANDNRLLILCALMEGDMTVSQIAHKIPQISQSALSQHLSLLRAHGILHSQKQGMHIFYRIEDTRILEIIAVLKKTIVN